MPKPEKPITLFEYNPLWPKLFEIEANDLRHLLKDALIEVHHFGSTSIKGMQAKQDLDILLVIDQLKDSLLLEQHGFVFKGELNVPLRYYFSKNTSRSKVNLHVCEKNHPFIALNLIIRDYFRAHPAEAKRYVEVKLKALRNKNAHNKIRWFLSEYGAEKNEYIKTVIDKSKYRGLTVNFCMHHNEWENYHRIKNEQIFKPVNITYDPNHPSFSNPNHYHFCLYLGSKVIAIAHIEILGKKSAALRPFAVDTPFQKKGYGKFFLSFLERWLTSKEVKTIHLHANVKAIPFYQKKGYVFMPFNDLDPGLPSKSKDMGKLLSH